MSTQQPEVLNYAAIEKAILDAANGPDCPLHFYVAAKDVAFVIHGLHARVQEMEAERAAIIAERNEYKYALRHAQNELEAQLSAIGAGGVEPLQKHASMAASERELFEAVASDNGKWPKAIERDARGNYLLLTTANGWMWWREARSLLADVPAPAAQAQMLRKALEYIEVHSFGGTDTLALIDELRKFLSAAPQAQKGETT